MRSDESSPNENAACRPLEKFWMAPTDLSCIAVCVSNQYACASSRSSGGGGTRAAGQVARGGTRMARLAAEESAGRRGSRQPGRCPLQGREVQGSCFHLSQGYRS